MKKKAAYELELRAASQPPPKMHESERPAGEVIGMLVRRGLQPERASREVPFPLPLDERLGEALSRWLSHYAFRLFLRGAIRDSHGFLPAETTRYVSRDQCWKYAEVLVDLGLAEKVSRWRYRMKHAAGNFGGTLEWYVGHELAKYGFDVETGIKLHVRGGGGDLDVVAAAEGKLVYVELKSSPPRNLDAGEVGAFLDRLALLRPDVAIFVVDTALRLSDKVLPLFAEELGLRNSNYGRPVMISAGQWAITPHLYVVNGSRHLIANIMKAVAEGFRALSPSYPGLPSNRR